MFMKLLLSPAPTVAWREHHHTQDMYLHRDPLQPPSREATIHRSETTQTCWSCCCHTCLKDLEQLRVCKRETLSNQNLHYSIHNIREDSPRDLFHSVKDCLLYHILPKSTRPFGGVHLASILPSFNKQSSPATCQALC